MGNNELLPCPFCGAEARLGRNPFIDGFQVRCDNFECDPMPLTVIHDTRAGAIEAWNTRAETRPERDLRDEVNWMHAELHGAEMGRTCRIVKKWSDSDYVDGWRYRCSECMCFIPVSERDLETGEVISAANYCPNCGARVVS